MRYMMFTVLLMWLLAAPTQARQPDDYWNSPRSTYEERRALFLDYYSENGSGCKCVTSAGNLGIVLAPGADITDLIALCL